MNNRQCNTSFFQNYKKSLITLIDNIDDSILVQCIEAMNCVEKNKGKIYLIGNGGSAATASHMANDFGAGLKRRGIKNFNIESLSDNSSVCTALANDVGFENIFYEQIKNQINEKDLLIAISCSGNSPNIIKAVKYAKEQSAKIIALTGFNGGELQKICDINYHIQTKNGEYGLVEDLHMIFDHMIYSYYIFNDKTI